jgi:hypothetical protein
MISISSPTRVHCTDGIANGFVSSLESVLRISSGPTQSRAMAWGKIHIATRRGLGLDIVFVEYVCRVN